MRTLSHCLAFFLAAMSAAAPGAACAGDVIGHPSVTLTVDEVKELYLGDKQLAGGLQLLPVDNAAQQADFLSRVLGVDATRYATRWTKKAFREGLSAPALKGGDVEVGAFVKANPGAVGYVTAAQPGQRVLGKY